MPAMNESVTSPSRAGPFSIQLNGARHALAKTSSTATGKSTCQEIPVMSEMAIAMPPISAVNRMLSAITSLASGRR